MSAQPLSLFDYRETQGASRRRDGATSKAAARSIFGQYLRDQQALVLVALVERHRRLCNGGNAWEIQCHLVERGQRFPQINVIGKRLGELEAAGMVRKVGERPGQSSRQQHVFVPTPAGEQWATGYKAAS